MVRPPAHRLLLIALTAVFGVFSAIPRGGATSFHLATGDHLHLLLGDQGAGHHHDDGLAHAHDSDNEHSGGATDGEPSAGDAHRHECVDIGLPGGDYKSSSPTAGVDLQGWATLPPFPPSFSLTVKSPPPERDRAHCALGFTPPDLVRSTVLLI